MSEMFTRRIVNARVDEPYDGCPVCGFEFDRDEWESTLVRSGGSSGYDRLWFCPRTTENIQIGPLTLSSSCPGEIKECF